MGDERESRVRLVGEFQDRLEGVRARIEQAARRAGRDPGMVTLVAVSKTVSVGRLQEAVACGCRLFGESRVQEALAKMEAMKEWAASEAPAAPGRARGAGASETIPMGARAPGEIEWHLIGPIQSNKARSVVGRFSLLHAVDRLEVAERLDRVARERGTVQPVLLEVNVTGEVTKHGFKPDDLACAAERMGALSGLRLLGLMTIPPLAADPEEARPHFRRVRHLAATVEALKIPGITMKELSMGMSGDFEVAVEEGATMVRIGTALFGPRPAV
ncbi:MAG TPA: YggS family pyridoxal phosphate-dependent enzyme [Nitrospirales bacterium]|nr:YggS family pyridoxal phosphate-dependent enzyme [Nitrospirales bacterium]